MTFMRYSVTQGAFCTLVVDIQLIEKIQDLEKKVGSAKVEFDVYDLTNGNMVPRLITGNISIFLQGMFREIGTTIIAEAYRIRREYSENTRDETHRKQINELKETIIEMKRLQEPNAVSVNGETDELS